MRLLLVVLGVLVLGGCARASWSPIADAQHGRYVGVGIYGPGKQWTKLVLAEQSKDEAAAKLIDDQVVIVVADSVTGELRACGDLTGYCIGMNPWKKSLVSSQVAPIELTGHVKPDQPDITVATTVSLAPQHSKHHRHKPAAKPHAPPSAAPAVS